MPNASSLAAIAQGHLVLTVDDKRAANDAFRLPVALRDGRVAHPTSCRCSEAATVAFRVPTFGA